MSDAIRIKSGDIFDYTPSADVPAGSIVLQGELFGVATADIANGKPGSLDASGIYDVDKAAATTFTAGAIVYWNNTDKLAVATDGSGTHKRLGLATAAAGNGPVVVRTMLNA